MRAIILVIQDFCLRVTGCSCCFLLGFIGLLTPLSFATAQERNGQDAGFLAEVEAGWEKLIESDSAQMSYSIQRQFSRTFPPDIKRDPQNKEENLRIVKGLKGVLIEFPRILDAGNPDYQFQLRRKEPTEPWTLAGTEKASGNQAAYHNLLTSKAHMYLLYPSSSYMLPGSQLLKALKDGQLQLLSHRALPSGLDAATFQWRMPPAIGPEEGKKMEDEARLLPAEQRDKLLAALKERMQERPPVLKGEMKLDPALNYAIVESEGISDNRPEVTLKFKRKAHKEQSERRTVICDSTVESYVGTNWLQEETLNFADFSNKPASDDTFYLSHFKFPEYVGVTPPAAKNPIWLYILGAAVGLLALSVVLRQLWKRTNARATAK